MKARSRKGSSAPLPGQLDLFSMTLAPDATPAVKLGEKTPKSPPRGQERPAPSRKQVRTSLPVVQTPSLNASPTHSARSKKASTKISGKASQRPAIQKPPRKQTERKSGALFDVIAAAEHCGLSVSTLNKLRCRGGGPKFVKITGAAVRYDPKDLDAWITSRRRGSTSEGQR